MADPDDIPEIETSLAGSHNDPSLHLNYLTLRRLMGILGLFLPLVLIIGNSLIEGTFCVRPSLSHYYYTDLIVVFTGTLVTFGVFLIAYKGYDLKGKEKISDNFITNLAGILIIIVAFIPTCCHLDETSCVLILQCPDVPNGHVNPIFNTIHLGCAALFIFLMGYMSFFHFTKSGTESRIKRRRKKIYKISGIVIWAVLAVLGVFYFFNLEIFAQDILIGETIALMFFGLAWLIKSEALEGMGM